MFVNPDGKLQLATADIKEQLHHLPRGWTKTLPDHSRHRAIANGWHISAARWFVLLSIFLAQVPVNVAIPQERHPWGSNAIDFMVGLWQSAPLLAGPGVPVLGDALDLSSILSVKEHWEASAAVLHPAQQVPRIEPGIEQWLPL